MTQSPEVTAKPCPIFSTHDTLNYILSQSRIVKKAGTNAWKILCPAHDDTDPSLNVTYTKDGVILMKCYAGCKFEDVLSALNLQTRDLFPDRQRRRNRKQGEIVAIYDYRDETGKLLFQVCRKANKQFQQRRPDGKGGWIYNLEGVRRVIYRLPEVLKAVQAGEIIFKSEGEKDVDNLVRLGLPATCNPGGAGKWKKEYAEYFQDARVVILPDNDEPGQKHAKQVALSLYGKARSIKILNLPGLPEKGDVSDWLQAGGTKEELLALVEAAPEWEPNPEDLEETKPKPKKEKVVPGAPAYGKSLSELGNAQRFTILHKGSYKYCPELDKWLVWDSTRWAVDNTGAVKRAAKEVVMSLYAEAAAASDDEEREAIVRHAMKSEKRHAIEAMINLAESEPGMFISFHELDRDPWLLNCKNGTINLKTGELYKHRKEDFISLISPVEYQNPPNREAQRVWTSFLERILPDPDVRDFVQRAAGYSITGDTSEEKLFFPYGPPATGKSTFLCALQAALGDYAATADFETFLVRNRAGSGPRNDIARLAKKRLVISLEVSDGARLAEALICQLTGGDTVTARFLYREAFEFVPAFKLWLAANHRPRLNSDKTAGIWRRILQIPFDVQIPPEERDPKLKAFLKDPTQGGPAVLAWLVEGCLKWQTEGLGDVPQAIVETTEEYRAEMDPLKDFLNDVCIINPLAKVANSRLFSAYEEWCRENGERFPLGRKRFTQLLKNYGFSLERTSKQRFWQGLGLLSDRNMTDVTDDDTYFNNFLYNSPRVYNLQDKVSRSVISVTQDKDDLKNVTI